MHLNLSLNKVDSYVDIVLNKRSDVIFQRQEYTSPEKIIYSVRLPTHDNVSFQVFLHKIDEGVSEITFPMHIQHTAVLPLPEPSGGTIEVSSGRSYEPSFKNKDEEAIYKLCHSIWLKVRLNEIQLNRKNTSTKKTGKSLNNEPPTKSSLPKVPNKIKRLNEWKACWAMIKSEWKKGGRSYEWLADYLIDNELPTTAETVAKIVKAGEAGLLDKTDKN